MKRTNIEIKARCSKEHQDEIRNYLNNNNAKYIGIDNQTDIYFQVKKGRLKLRKGNIENSLIYYEKDDERGSKKSKVIICKNNEPSSDLENIVRQIHDVLVEINKKREIYFIDNVKFHIDEVIGLGNFIEIEAISENNSLCEEKIKKFINEFNSEKTKKALVLHGPPGTGKTTLAHVSAIETNSEIFELNASDLRNKERLEAVLKPAIEQKSLIFKNKIILVDEVDGISAVDRGGLPELISLIETSNFPIIITANDIWGSKLSPLRKKVELVHLKEVDYKTIKEVLIWILRKEKHFV